MRFLVAVITRPIGCILGGVLPDRVDPVAHGEGELEEFGFYEVVIF
jgi:hypothetical protein